MNYPKVLGSTLGDPNSPRTYSGVPYHCFAELRRLGALVGSADSLIYKGCDYLTGLLDVRRSLREGRPRRNALWRFRRNGISALSRRFQAIEREMPEHDVVLQISGVGAVPLDGVRLAAHVEISVRTAAGLPEFAPQYGFAYHSDRAIEEAAEGERYFLQRCSLVFTNSTWCAQGLRAQGVPDAKLRVRPPAAGARDPGPIERRWDRCDIVFVGIDWERKGGPLLLQAFHEVRRALPTARLTIIGCSPKASGPGVRVLGFLRKDEAAERRVFEDALREATIFCMPSSWESVGLVYMEAALYGLPLVMLKGQGREEIFPDAMAVHLEEPAPSRLAERLIALARDPAAMARMGSYGREHVLARHTWPIVARQMLEDLERAVR